MFEGKNKFIIVLQYHCHMWATKSEMPLDEKWNKLHPLCRASSSPTLSLFTQLQRAQWHDLQAAAILFDFRHYVFYVIHIHAQTVKVQEYINKCTKWQYKIFTIKTLNSDVFRPFLVGHFQGVHINICIKVLYKYWCTLPEDGPQERSLSVLIVKTLYCDIVHVLVYSWNWTLMCK